MKTLLLASALALTTVGAAFAAVTTYADGSAYDDATGVAISPPTAYAMSGKQTATDTSASHRTNDPRVVRWGLDNSDIGGP